MTEVKQIPQTGALERPPEPNDYFAGKATDIPNRFENANASKYKPSGEKQHHVLWKFDSMSCVSFKTNNSAELQLNYLYREKLMPVEARKFLEDHGYIVDGEINLSDRFLAILSETTKDGNYGTKVAQAFVDFGAIPESMLPWGGETFAEYHNKSLITEEMKALGQEFKRHFSSFYAWVVTQGSRPLSDDQRDYMYQQIKQAPLGRLADGHATIFHSAIYKQKWLELEHYVPFDREKDWKFDPPWVLKIIIQPKTMYTEEEIMTARKRVQQIIINQHGVGKFFRPEVENGAHGEAYWVGPDGSFTYETATGTMFKRMIQNKEIIPVSEDQFKEFIPAEIKN